VFSLKEINETSVLDPYISDLFQYFSLLYAANASNNVELMKSILALIGDIAGLYGKKIQTLLVLPFVSTLTDAFMKSSNKEYKKIANWTKVSIEKALK
jgi:hypothetical protein